MITPHLTTLDCLLQREAELFHSADLRLGWPVAMARDATLLLSNFMASVSADRHVFVRCMAVIKVHHTLAYMSTLRLHHVQSMMNLRQVTEATPSAAFALAHPELDLIDSETGLVRCPKKISAKSYKWIGQAFPRHSSDLKMVKDIINEESSHFNIVNSTLLVTEPAEGEVWRADFFDLEDSHFELTDLWLSTQLALCSINLMIEVAKVHGGFVLAIDAEARAKNIQVQADKLRADLMNSKRHQRATASAKKAKKS